MVDQSALESKLIRILMDRARQLFTTVDFVRLILLTTSAIPQLISALVLISILNGICFVLEETNIFHISFAMKFMILVYLFLEENLFFQYSMFVLYYFIHVISYFYPLITVW